MISGILCFVLCYCRLRVIARPIRWCIGDSSVLNHACIRSVRQSEHAEGNNELTVKLASHTASLSRIIIPVALPLAVLGYKRWRLAVVSII